MGRLKNAAPTLPSTIERPKIDDGSGSGDFWVVTVYNNEVNTWDEVVDVLMRATGCTHEEADIETWEIDTLGKSVVHHGDRDVCESVAEVIRQIGIQVEVTSE